MKFPREEQYKLLEDGKLRDLVRDELGDDFRRVSEIITLTQDEYAAWDLTKPLDRYIRTSPGSQDGWYFIERGETWWVIYEQERGGVNWKEHFKCYEDARRYLAVELGIGRHLRKDSSNEDASAKETELTSTENLSLSDQHKTPRAWWKFWR